jgi:hypothetical protein
MASFWRVKFIWTHFLELFQHSTETLAMQQTQNPHFYLEIFLLGFFLSWLEWHLRLMILSGGTDKSVPVVVMSAVKRKNKRPRSDYFNTLR